MANKTTCIIVALAVVALILINSQAQAVHHTDCMKNPFASGCRGISAKRASWSFNGPNGDQREQIPGNYLIDGDSELAASSGLPATSRAGPQQDGAQWRSTANLGAAELLIVAANRLLRDQFNNPNNQRGE